QLSGTTRVIESSPSAVSSCLLSVAPVAAHSASRCSRRSRMASASGSSSFTPSSVALLRGLQEPDETLVVLGREQEVALSVLAVLLDDAPQRALREPQLARLVH